MAGGAVRAAVFLGCAALAAGESRVAKATGPPAFFLQDAQSDGHCLGDGIFKRCAVDTLWYVQGKPGGYTLHRRKVDESEDDLCLDRASCTLPESNVRLGNCKHCGAHKWNIVGDNEKGYILTEDEGKNCLSREKTNAKMELCEKKNHVALSLQFATKDDIRAMESAGARLIAAAAEGDERAVKAFLKDDGARQRVDVNARDWDNLTALVAACAGGHKKLANTLLKELGADPMAADKDNITSLMEASIAGHRDVAELLLKTAPQLLDFKAASGVSALWLASGEGQLKVAELLVKNDADVNNARSDGITALMAAASGGHTAVAKLLVQGGADVHAVDRDGLTALMNAAENGTAAAVLFLVNDAKSDVNKMSTTGFTPLIVAAAGGHAEACKVLLDNGADLSRVHSEGVDALMYAAAGGHLETAKLLIARGADVKALHAHGGSALIEAATAGDVPVLELLIKEGADALLVDSDGVNALMSAASQGRFDATKYLVENFPQEIDLAAHSGGTALMFAAAGGHTEVVQLMIEHKGDVNLLVHGTPEYVVQVAEQIAAGKEDVEAHKEDVTALQVAAQAGHLATVQLLLKHGAETKQADEEGSTALTNAVAGGHTKVAYALVAAGADPNDSYVDTAAKKHNLLLDAISTKDERFAVLLVEKGADLSHRDARGVSLLLTAAHGGLNATVDALLNAGADANERNDEGVDALIAASSEGHATVVSSLLASGKLVSVDAADKDGTTALMAAAVRGHAAIITLLLAAGVKVDVQNADGHSALMFAYNGKSQVATLLQKYLSVVKPESQATDSNLDVIYAALKSHGAIIDALVASGASNALTDADGRAAADFDFKEPKKATGDKAEL